MLKVLVSAIVASMLFALPVLFYINQTAQCGDGNEYSASSQLVSEDNCIVGGDVTQVSVIDFGTPPSEDNSGGGSNGGNEGGSGDNNNGGGDNGGSDGNSGGNGGSSGNNEGGDNGGSGGNSGGNDGSNSGGGNGGDSGGSGGNSGGNGGSDGDNGGNGGNGGSGGNNNGGGDSGGDSGESETGTAGPISNNSTVLVLINEIHPDIESSGNYANGKVELYNPGAAPVNLNQWYLSKLTGFIIGTINNQEIGPRGFLVVNVSELTGNYQEITLLDSNGKKRDSATYTGARSHNGSCYARIPDGGDSWKWTTCTLGYSNR